MMDLITLSSPTFWLAPSYKLCCPLSVLSFCPCWFALIGTNRPFLLNVDSGLGAHVLGKLLEEVWIAPFVLNRGTDQRVVPLAAHPVWLQNGNDGRET